MPYLFFFSSRRRHTRCSRDWSSDVCSSDLPYLVLPHPEIERVIVETAQATGRVEIRYRTRVVRLLENGGRVCGAVLASDGCREEEVRARLVVGADGAASAVRAAVGIELPRTQYNHALF